MSTSDSSASPAAYVRWPTDAPNRRGAGGFPIHQVGIGNRHFSLFWAPNQNLGSDDLREDVDERLLRLSGCLCALAD